MLSQLPEWQCFAVTCDEPNALIGYSTVVSPINCGWCVEMNGSGSRDWMNVASRLLQSTATRTSYLLTNGDPASTSFRAVKLDNDGAMKGVLLVSPAPLEIARDWVMARLGTTVDAEERFNLLDGRHGGAMRPRGSIVCVCCFVGENDIRNAVVAGQTTFASVMAATRAGSNCGRCQSEVERIILAVTGAF